MEGPKFQEHIAAFLKDNSELKKHLVLPSSCESAALIQGAFRWRCAPARDRLPKQFWPHAGTRKVCSDLRPTDSLNWPGEVVNFGCSEFSLGNQQGDKREFTRPHVGWSDTDPLSGPDTLKTLRTLVGETWSFPCPRLGRRRRHQTLSPTRTLWAASPRHPPLPTTPTPPPHPSLLRLPPHPSLKLFRLCSLLVTKSLLIKFVYMHIAYNLHQA